MLYHKVLLSDLSLVGVPTTLPATVAGLQDADLADLSWCSDEDLKPYCFLRVVINEFGYDEYTEFCDKTSLVKLTVNPERAQVSANYEIKPLVKRMARQITKLAFNNLFTLQERAGILKAKKFIANLTPSEYSDISNLGYLYLDIILQKLEASGEFIDLHASETINAVSVVLVESGILTQERAEYILTGRVPL